MKILPISHTHYSFKNSPVYLQEINGLQPYTDTFVKNSFESDKNNTSKKLTDQVFNNITNFWTERIDSFQRYNSNLNKAEMLNQIAHSLYKAGEVEKSAVTLAESFNQIPKKVNFNLEKERRNSLIHNPENLNILKDFYQTSVNKKSRLFVMESLRKLNSADYLPVAEDILEFDKDTALYSDRATTLSARRFLHSHYNFNLLPISKSFVYKNAALTVFDKWGVPEDISIFERLKQDKDIQIRSKAKNVESHLRRLNIQESLTDEKEMQGPAPKKPIPIDTIVDQISTNNEMLSELKKHKYPNGVFNASLLIEKAPSIQNPEVYSEVIKFIGQTGAYIDHLNFVKPESETDTEKAEAYCKILLRNNAKSVSFGKTPSFGTYIKQWDKKKFDPLNAPDSTLDDLAEIFNAQYSDSIKDDIESRYPEGFFQSFFAHDAYTRMIDTAYTRLNSRVEKIKKHKNELLKESNPLIEKKALGCSNRSKQKVRLRSTFLEYLKLKDKAPNVTTGILIYGKAMDEDKQEFIDWLSKEADAAFFKVTYNPEDSKSSLKEITENLKTAESYYNTIGKRTIIYVDGIDKLLTDKNSSSSQDDINEFKILVENAGKSYATFLVKTNYPIGDFNSAAIASHRFGLKLNLSEGITEEEDKRLEAISKEIYRLKDRSYEYYKLFKSIDIGEGGNDCLYRSLVYDTDF